MDFPVRGSLSVMAGEGFCFPLWHWDAPSSHHSYRCCLLCVSWLTLRPLDSLASLPPAVTRNQRAFDWLFPPLGFILPSDKLSACSGETEPNGKVQPLCTDEMISLFCSRLTSYTVMFCQSCWIKCESGFICMHVCGLWEEAGGPRENPADTRRTYNTEKPLPPRRFKPWTSLLRVNTANMSPVSGTQAPVISN